MMNHGSEQWYKVTYIGRHGIESETYRAKSMAEARKIAAFKVKARGADEYSVTKA